MDNFDHDDESDRDTDILDASDEDEDDDNDNDDADVPERFPSIVKVASKESDKEKSPSGNTRCNHLYVGYMK